MKNDLKMALKEYYGRNLPQPDGDGIKQTILKARNAMLTIHFSDESLSFWEFYWSQISFVKKKVWLVQFLTLLFCGITLLETSNMPNTIGLASTIIPLVFLSGARELSRAFVYDTVEVELATRFTIRQVILSRITLIGLADVFVLTIIGVMAAFILPIKMPFIFMYLCVPFLITAIGCLCILNHLHTKKCDYYCGVWGAIVMITLFFLSKAAPVLYEASLIWGWTLLFVIALLGVVLEGWFLLKNCSRIIFTESWQ